MNGQRAPVPSRGANPRSSGDHTVSDDLGSGPVLPAKIPAERGELPAPLRLDRWIVPPDTARQRKRGRGSGRRTETMTQALTELVEQFCNFQRKQRGKTEGGVKAYRWNLEQFLVFIRNRHGRLARVTDLTPATVQSWM